MSKPLKLDYQTEIERTFYKISPLSSGVRKCQTTPKNPPDFSIVTYIDANDKKEFQKAMDIIFGLRAHTNNELNLSLERKYYDTLWCTLGFFDEDDFPIDYHTSSAFNSPKLRRFNHTITVTKVEITEFTLKSLDDGITDY